MNNQDNNKYSYTYASLDYRSRKNGQGYRFDFMVLANNDNEMPYINIYYYDDNTDKHSHYIIDVFGDLELCHSNYKEDEFKKKTDNVHNFIFALHFDRKIMKKKMVVDYLCLKDRIRYDHYIERYAHNHRIDYCDIEKMLRKYDYLINKSVSMYTGSNYNDYSICDLITILKSVNCDLPQSKKNKIK